MDVQQIVILEHITDLLEVMTNKQKTAYNPVTEIETYTPLVHDIKADGVVRVVKALDEVADMGLQLQVLAESHVVDHHPLQLWTAETG